MDNTNVSIERHFDVLALSRRMRVEIDCEQTRLTTNDGCGLRFVEMGESMCTAWETTKMILLDFDSPFGSIYAIVNGQTWIRRTEYSAPFTQASPDRLLAKLACLPHPSNVICILHKSLRRKYILILDRIYEAKGR